MLVRQAVGAPALRFPRRSLCGRVSAGSIRASLPCARAFAEVGCRALSGHFPAVIPLTSCARHLESMATRFLFSVFGSDQAGSIAVAPVRYYFGAANSHDAPNRREFRCSEVGVVALAFPARRIGSVMGPHGDVSASVLGCGDVSMGLQSYAFQTEYRSGYDDLVRDFYHPALDRADRYSGAVGFFSSSAPRRLATPWASSSAPGGTVRLITSVRLEASDIRAITEGLSSRAGEQRLLEQIKSEFVAPLGRGASLLAALLEVGSLEIRILFLSRARGCTTRRSGSSSTPKGIMYSLRLFQ